jgi:dipeptidyl aminopeptidase/acylaminoacyl peptidase
MRTIAHPLLIRVIFLGILPALLALPAAAADETPAVAPIAVDAVLATDAIPLALPAFHDAEQAGVDWDDLLQEMVALPGVRWPRQGDAFASASGHSVSWGRTTAADGRIAWKTTAAPSARYLAFYVQSDRWQKITLKVNGDHPVLGAVDGQDLKFTTKDGEEGAPTERTGELKLTVGKHLVVLRTLYQPETEGEWAYALSVTPSDTNGALAIGTTADRAVDIQTVLNAPRIGNVSLSPDGKLAVLGLSEYRNGSDQESWLEVRETKTGKLVRLWRGSHAPSGVDWHPRGHRITWQVTTGETASLHTYDFDSGETAVVLADVKDLGSWRWAPDGQSIVYAVNRKPDPDERKVKRVLYPADRQPWWRGRSHLRQVFVPSGVTRRLTAGPVSADGWEISPDGQQMIFFTSEQDLANRPYFTSEMWLLDLGTLEVAKVLSDPWIGGASWSPDGKKLLLQGSPSAFDGLGRNLPAGMPANDYGGQLYTYDLAKREPTAISVGLRPDVSWSAWSVADGMIYARTTDTQYNTVYRLKPGKDKWEQVATGVDAAGVFALARTARTAVVRGSSATAPNTAHTVDLKQNRARLLLDPGTAWYRDVVFGKVENWVAELDKGMAMDGFVYYPPGFDASRKYPVIVYYYGGTSPITRDFGGRYPKNVWAGQDYIVYVPNPSGATGYGQEFAARHVNDWGRLTAAEVIEGTEKFLAAHPFADADRVGCMGASYGGFLTEYIVTQTDLFAAAVSHAGISDISSYWGEGLWGYAYGARALSGSFPWADRDLFVEQSPLFHADKVTTPLLLVHGDADVNVPKGESDQLFTALKLLGKEVEYVQIVGQDHHILDHGQRIVWNDTILAFLAKHLKQRSAWWDELYPAAEDYR